MCGQRAGCGESDVLGASLWWGRNKKMEAEDQRHLGMRFQGFPQRVWRSTEGNLILSELQNM